MNSELVMTAAMINIEKENSSKGAENVIIQTKPRNEIVITKLIVIHYYL